MHRFSPPIRGKQAAATALSSNPVAFLHLAVTAALKILHTSLKCASNESTMYLTDRRASTILLV